MRRVGYLIDQIDLNGQNKELIDELVSLSTKYGILTPYTVVPGRRAGPAARGDAERRPGRRERSVA